MNRRTALGRTSELQTRAEQLQPRIELTHAEIRARKHLASVRMMTFSNCWSA